MAKPVSQITLGIDVAKHELVIVDWDTGSITKVPNQPARIKQWLATLVGPVRMALEPTSHYHLVIADLAQSAGQGPC